MSFTAKLPAGHELLGKRSADLQALLSLDKRVLGSIPTSLPDRKEWASALAWLDSHAPVLLADLQSLADKEISTLGSIFDLGSGKTPARLALVIHAFLSDNVGGSSPATSFGEMLQLHDSELHRTIGGWGARQLRSALKDAPAYFTAGAEDPTDLRERYAFFLWASSAGSPEDFAKLPSDLQDWSYNVLNVPMAEPPIRADNAGHRGVDVWQEVAIQSRRRPRHHGTRRF